MLVRPENSHLHLCWHITRLDPPFEIVAGSIAVGVLREASRGHADEQPVSPNWRDGEGGRR